MKGVLDRGDGSHLEAHHRAMASRQSSFLPWIVAFKAFKTALLATLGTSLLISVHRDPVDTMLQLAQAVHLPLTSRVFDRALNLAFRATPKNELGLGVTAIGYAILLGTEGVGLYLRCSWARWLTVGATSSLIPLELYEIVRQPRPLRMVILALNTAVVIYLIKRKDVFEGDSSSSKRKEAR